MSPRVQADRVQKRLRTPRIPKFSSHSVLFSKALMKSVSLFIQGFFIAHPGNAVDLFRIAFSEKAAFKKSSFRDFPQFYICFPTSVI